MHSAQLRRTSAKFGVCFYQTSERLLFQDIASQLTKVKQLILLLNSKKYYKYVIVFVESLQTQRRWHL